MTQPPNRDAIEQKSPVLLHQVVSLLGKKPNPPTPLRAREGGERRTSPCRRGVGGEVLLALLLGFLLVSESVPATPRRMGASIAQQPGATGDKAGEATTLNNIGQMYLELGENQKALNYYNQSLPLRRAVGDKAGEATTLFNIASFERNRNNLNAALTNIEAAIKIVEQLRSKIISQDLRASYFATVQNYYKFYIDLLMQLHKTNPTKGYDAIALHISERARARSFLELLAESGANIRQGVDPQLLAIERSLLQQLNAAEATRLQPRQGSEADLKALEQKIATLSNQLQELEAQIKQKSPRYAALKYPEPLTLPQIQQQVLDNDTILLQYSLGDDRSYLWAVTKTGITSYELPKRADIEAAVQTYLKQIKSKSPNPETGTQLSQILLAPVANQLGNQRLLIVGDGVLQLIPFAALPLGQNPLIAQNEIVTLPSASSIAILRQQVQGRTLAPKAIAAIADPVFESNDPRLQNSAQTQAETDNLNGMALTRSLSLWSVSTVETSELMQIYYKKMLQSGLNPVAAMRATQLEMIKSQQWKAPYYWASFVIQGEWR